MTAMHGKNFCKTTGQIVNNPFDFRSRRNHPQLSTRPKPAYPKSFQFVNSLFINEFDYISTPFLALHHHKEF